MAAVDDIERFEGKDFQQLASALLDRVLPGFNAVEGSGGDSGNDGFTIVGTKTVVQVFGPRRLELTKVKAKIRESLQKAQALRRKDLPGLEQLIFVTNGDLTHRAHVYFQAESAKRDFVCESWGATKLRNLLGDHPEVRALFAQLLLPDIAQNLRRQKGGFTPADEVKRRQIDLAETVFGAYGRLVRELLPWKGVTISYEEWAVRIAAVRPECAKLVDPAKFYLPGTIGSQLEEILNLLRFIEADEQTIRAMRPLNVQGATGKIINRSFERSHFEIPAQIDSMWQQLERPLRRIVDETADAGGSDQQYEAWKRKVFERLTSHQSVSLDISSSEVSMAYRARAEGLIDVERVGEEFVLLLPGTIDRNA